LGLYGVSLSATWFAALLLEQKKCLRRGWKMTTNILLLGIFTILFYAHVWPKVYELYLNYKVKSYKNRMKLAITEWSQTRPILQAKHNYDFWSDIKHIANQNYYYAAKAEIERINKKHKVNIGMYD